MPTNLVEVAQYVTPISHPNPGESASATQLRTGVSQVLADRTKYLFLQSVGVRVPDASSSLRTLFATTDDITCIYEWPEGATYGLAIYGGTNGRILTSLQPDSSSNVAPGGAYAGTFESITSSPTKALLVGTANGLQTLVGGVATSRTPGAGAGGAISFHAAACDGVTTFIAVGEAAGVAEIQQSTDDGVTWARVTHPAASAVKFVGACFAGSRFYILGLDAGGTSAYVLTSVDGSSWTLASTTSGNFSQLRNGLATSGDTVVFGGRDLIYRSVDLGASFSGVAAVSISSAAGYPANFRAITFANGVFVAAAASSIGGISTELFIASEEASEWFCRGWLGNPGPLTLDPICAYGVGTWWLNETDGRAYRGLTGARF